MPSSPTPLKFWHQSMTELAGQGAYSRYLSSHARKILGDEVQVDVRGLRHGSYHGHAPTEALENAFVYHRVCDQIIDNALQAEREGYAAFVIGSFSEPYLREIRSAVNITVASVLESSMLVACSLGKKTVAIANAPQIAFMVQAAIEKHGLSSRVLPVLSVDPPLTEPEMAVAFDNPAPLVQAFVRAAENAVRGGADFIVPAESILATLMTDSGITQIHGAPVMDVIAVAWRYALMLVRLKACSGLEVSHIGHYARADPALLAAFTA
jgi:allantoin racemase